jgi:ABC-type Na+ transport system ATPase subunit NatA
VEGYSKGMKQRLMVARALVNRPRILFLSEHEYGSRSQGRRAQRGRGGRNRPAR